MTRLFPPIALGLFLLTSAAVVAQPPQGTGLERGEEPSPPPPPGWNGQPPPPPRDIFAGLPRPLSAEDVSKALEEQFARRPHVGQVTAKNDKTLTVQVISPDGRVNEMTVDRETGARLPLR